MNFPHVKAPRLPPLKKSLDVSTPWGSFAVAALLIGIAGVFWFGARSLKDASDWVDHTQSNRANIEGVVASIKDAESSQRNYLLTNDLKQLRRSLLAQETSVRQAKGLRSALRDQEQQKKADALLDLIVRRVQAMGQVETTYQSSGLPEAQALIAQFNVEDVSQGIVEKAGELLAVENQFLEERQTRSERVAWLLQGVAMFGMVLAVVLVILMGRSTRRELVKRGQAVETAEQANAQLESTVTRIEADRVSTGALARFAGLLQACPTVEEAFRVSAHSLALILPDTAGTLYLLRNSRDHVEAMADWGAPTARPNQMGPQDCWSLRVGKSFDSQAEALLCPHLTGSDPAFRTCVPLRAQGMDLGVLVIEHAKDWDHVVLAEAAAEQLALAVANLRLRETLRTQSLRDPLTGLPNRRELEEALPREAARAERTAEPLTMLVLDIDHFKRFNDTYGHEAGDTVLQCFGRLLSETVRGEDLVVRLGGEEFVVLLPNTSAEAGAEHAERIRLRISQLTVEHHGQSLGNISASIGLATFRTHTHDIGQLLGLADAALYKAKSDGRNRVQVAGRE